MDKLVNSADRIFGLLALGLSVLTGSYEVLCGFADPHKRWIAWGFSAFLFGLAAYRHRVRRSSIMDSNSEPINRRNRWSMIGYFLTVSMLLILAIDAWHTLSRPPAYVSPANGIELARELEATTPQDSLRVLGYDDRFASEGYTTASKENTLVRENIQAIGFAVSAKDATEIPFSGETIRALIQKNQDAQVLTIRSIAARVVRFEEMPPCRFMKPVGAMVDTIEVSFILTRRDEPLPWVLKPQAVSINRGEIHESDRAFPYLIEESSPAKISCFFVAVDPGIYWIEPIAIVSDGVSKTRELRLSEQPLPIAFIGSNSPGGFPDDSEATDILSGKNKEWIPWPPISDSERRGRLESHRKWLEEKKVSGTNGT